MATWVRPRKLGQVEKNSVLGVTMKISLDVRLVNQSPGAELSESYQLLMFPFRLWIGGWIKETENVRMLTHLQQCGFGRIQLSVALHL